ncbi:prolyl oligopeptidase family serine peptidase [Paenibacillus profundus]|uniref:Prolyl oligopeptidase family serine peptidase n=1 Tax=Paenibacillus profundus TaxID=1173085 RepID=A0ABS8YMH5_9BACL|nr:prolyl oligopeptidase family serine peptidase [Paenibacillus profundus]MCE5173038.1 prolyl oligopeptidase family serine peptidase [Paenibacillus profundus]
MKKKVISAALAAVLVASVPMSVMAQEQTAATPWYKTGVNALVSKGIIGENADLTATVTVSDFVRYTVTALTYQHGVDPMKAAAAEGWIADGEFASVNAPVKRGEVARILVRAFDQEQGETSLAEYAERAKAFGLMKGYPDGKLHEQETATIREIASALDNYKKLGLSKIDNKGVPQISVEDFMRNPGSFAYQLSTDGNYISYAAPWENRANIFVQKMDGSSEPVRVTSSKDRDIAGFLWKGDHVLYLKDKGGDENYHLYSAAFNGNEEKDLTPFDKVRVGLVSMLSGVKDEILITMNKDDAKVFDVYKLNVKTGATKLVAKNPGNIQAWIPDHEGKIRLAVASDGIEGAVLYRNTEAEEFKPFITMGAGDTVNPLAFSKDNKTIYAVSNKGRDKAALVTYDLQGKENVMYSHPDVDLAGAMYDAKQDKLLMTAYMTDKVHVKFFDDKFEALYKKLQDKLNVSESEIGLNDYNQDMTKFIVSMSNDKTYGMYYYYDSTTDQLTPLANLSEWLKSDNMADMQPISYKSRDGLTIHGYLTLPKNKTPEQLPLIVNPHGGPWARDMWGFNPEVQLLANRGYAVLQVNFRSSTGYGKAFLDAGNKQWGRKIQNDITDGVQWAIKQGIADPDRVGIYGASFGGYATLAGITFTPDMYAAAVDYVGVSNIFTLLDTLPPYWETNRNMFYERVGHPEKDKELLKEVSPVFHADKIVTPLFVAQGANDPRVNKAESDQIVEALKKRGIDVEYMVKDNEGHGFNNEENRIEFYNAMLKFLDTHLKK